jgi:hypothetical protein
MPAPDIKTAIPKRRFKLGDFTLVFLGEIETTDAESYQYILAMVKDGEQAPSVFVVAEQARGEDKKQGSHRMRVLGPNTDQLIGVSDRWSNLDNFIEDSIAGAKQMFGLSDEEAFPIS